MGDITQRTPDGEGENVIDLAARRKERENAQKTNPDVDPAQKVAQLEHARVHHISKIVAERASRVRLRDESDGIKAEIVKRPILQLVKTPKFNLIRRGQTANRLSKGRERMLDAEMMIGAQPHAMREKELTPSDLRIAALELVGLGLQDFSKEKGNAVEFFCSVYRILKALWRGKIGRYVDDRRIDVMMQVIRTSGYLREDQSDVRTFTQGEVLGTLKSWQEFPIR